MKLLIKCKLGPFFQKEYDLNTIEDFEILCSIYPQVEESLYKYSDLKLIANDIANYFSNGHLDAQIED